MLSLCPRIWGPFFFSVDSSVSWGITLAVPFHFLSLQELLHFGSVWRSEDFLFQTFRAL